MVTSGSLRPPDRRHRDHSPASPADGRPRDHARCGGAGAERRVVGHARARQANGGRGSAIGARRLASYHWGGPSTTDRSITTFLRTPLHVHNRTKLWRTSLHGGASACFRRSSCELRYTSEPASTPHEALASFATQRRPGPRRRRSCELRDNSSLPQPEAMRRASSSSQRAKAVTTSRSMARRRCFTTGAAAGSR